MNNKITSITDQPILDVESDLLEAEKYANALSSFILESDTPLTIGMQGEWGTRVNNKNLIFKFNFFSFLS